ncbi:hypothetical protein GGTG_01152 [Gaeumannomyces tritici R3-111a-1]|uniref:Squalene/phytoene synthase n=1 Tax=Gaeumannomyces tritici (strain R3-111a-1) TaxID=644352 RepID=J3NIR8_GAET3|nr:hypothetical protein GGTG_01152 [Gaeumannomyces tritici R3-111a-1]EJT81168.1 hypothetical protein GGTG_01152 [Gaeumannomyces tritici R3-111a-1]
MLRTRAARAAARPRNAGPGSAPRRRGMATDADVDKARAYCQAQLRAGDYDSHLIRRFVPPPSRDAYDALRALNLELARLPETVSTPLLGRMRTQFWRDSVNATFAGRPPREPICILLHRALSDLSSRGTTTGGGGVVAPSTSSMKFWVQRLISTRELHMDNRPFASLAALEEYAEHTYATLTYAVLAAAPLRSLHLDHLASHIGKACGIVAVLRGIPILAAPRAPVQTPMGGGSSSSSGQQQALLLPLDVMARAGVREEDVFRKGPQAPGLQDAVFEVATRANDHLITAREMLKNLRAGRDAGHDYEHEGEAEHVYESREGSRPQQPGGVTAAAAAADEQVAADLRRGFGALLEAVPAADFLQRLEKQNFDPFKVGPSWKLPWSIWRALQKQQI